MYWKVLNFGNDVKRIKKLYYKALSAIENEDFRISEEEYYKDSEHIPCSVPIMPYENAMEFAVEDYLLFKYNLLSMTLIQIYSTWDQQKEDYQKVTGYKIKRPTLIEELRLVNNVLKHGKDGSSGENLYKDYPEYFYKTQESRINLYTTLNISSEKVTVFTDAIVSFWGAIIEKG